VTRRFTTEVIKSDDNTYRGEFRHDLRFGGSAQAGRLRRRRPSREITTVDFRNRFGLSEEEIADRLNLETGRPYEFFRVRERADKLEREFAKEGFLETNVRVSRAEPSRQDSSAVNLFVDGCLGPRVEIAFEGASLPSGVQ
jgi:hypothetical protein